MLLATRALTDDERKIAYGTVPAATDLRQVSVVAYCLIRNNAAEFFDVVLGSNFLREGLVAHSDALSLATRAAGLLCESKAAELYVAREDPLGYLDVAETEIDEEGKANLKRHYIETPIQDAAVRVDAR